MRRIVLINKSDTTGGAAVVSRRLMEALRREGADARMLVAERLSDSPHIATIASPLRIKATFAADRLRVALANGFDRDTLFKIDAAAAGVDLSRHPWVREADAILINWINQGVLSLGGIRRLLRAGKKVVWTMHDMWNFTGVCHHAGDCLRFRSDSPCGGSCGECPLLKRHASPSDLSARTLLAKERLYDAGAISFVAVSRWLADEARASRLLATRDLSVIPNAFPLPDSSILSRRIGADAPSLNLIFGAARLDDPIKDFPLLIDVTRALRERHPEVADRCRLHLYGGIKDASLLERLAISYTHHGMIRNPEKITDLYLDSHIVLSTSRRETLPGTLIEGLAHGCWPIAFHAGGQGDIITDGLTGSLLERSRHDAAAMADAIAAAPAIDCSVSRRLHESVERSFSAPAVAREYLRLLSELG